MKKIMIIDGGPRKHFNTASMLQTFAEGASSVSSEIEVKTIRLYDLDYKGCMSCMACKLKGKAVNICKFKDALTPILEEVAQADGLVMGSPIYFSRQQNQTVTFDDFTHRRYSRSHAGDITMVEYDIRHLCQRNAIEHTYILNCCYHNFRI